MIRELLSDFSQAAACSIHRQKEELSVKTWKNMR